MLPALGNRRDIAELGPNVSFCGVKKFIALHGKRHKSCEALRGKGDDRQVNTKRAALTRSAAPATRDEPIKVIRRIQLKKKTAMLLSDAAGSDFVSQDGYAAKTGMSPAKRTTEGGK